MNEKTDSEKKAMDMYLVHMWAIYCPIIVLGVFKSFIIILTRILITL